MSRFNKQLRAAGVVLLVAGLFVVHRSFPTRPPESWETVHGFHLDAEACRELREQRQSVDFAIPEEAGAKVTAGEVAKSFRLELPLVCAANERTDCGDDALTPGTDSLVLPLYRSPPAASREQP
jgi:hypothetical protein